MNLSNEQIEHMVRTMTKEERQAWVQNEAYQAWNASPGQRGTCEMATGTGKTRIGIRAAAEELQKNPQALVYIVVPTETLRDVDWPNEMKAAGYEGLEKKVRMICWAALSREIPDRDVDLIVLDEVHHLTTLNSIFFSRESYKVWKVMGLTATIPDDVYQNDKDKLLLIKMLCPVVFKFGLEEGIALKLIIEFELYILTFDLDDNSYHVDGGTKKKPFKTTELKRYRQLTKNLQRATWTKNDGAKFAAMQKRTQFLSNLSSKIWLANDVIKATMAKGERTLIFCGSIEQSVQLCGENVYNSKTSDAKLTAFCNKEINYLGVVEALNEGKNIPDVDQSLIVQGRSKQLTLWQRIGRNIRWRENHIARIILLVAKKTADEKWAESATANINPKRIKRHYVKPETQRQ